MEGWLQPATALVRVGLARGTAAAARISLMALCGALAGIAVTGATGCAVTALWIIALPGLGAAGAALTAAGALGLLSMALVALAVIVSRRGRKPTVIVHHSELLPIEVMRLMKDDKVAMLLAALVVGLAAGQVQQNRA